MTFVSAAPQPLVITAPALLLTLNQSYAFGMNAEALYEATRGNWVLKYDRVQTVQYVYAIYQGEVLEIYQPQIWFATDEQSRRGSARLRFSGVIAKDLQWQKGLSVSHYIQSRTTNPVRYLNC